MSNPTEVPVRRLTLEEVRNAGATLSRSGFVTGDAHDAAVAVLRAQIAELTKDKQRLDSGRILTQERDDFGQPYKCERRGVDLRASIDEAMAMAQQDKGPAVAAQHEAPVSTKPILVWKALFQRRPEPLALLTYGGKTFAIPYSLMDWIYGWVIMGQRGTHVAAVDAILNSRAMFQGLVEVMGRDASPLTPEQAAFYSSHGLQRDVGWPEIKDFNEEPEVAL